MNPFVFLFFLNVACGALIPAKTGRIVLRNVNPSDSRNITAAENRRRLKLWSDAAYERIRQENCTDSGIICGLPCEAAKNLSKQEYRVYAVEPISGEKYTAVFIENDYKYKSTHDNVLVLDPFPTARFGHPVVAFYIDTNTTSSYCDRVKGFMVGKCRVFTSSLSRLYEGKLESYITRERLI